MSETVRNDVSIESICTVIENTPVKQNNNNCNNDNNNSKSNQLINKSHVDSSENETQENSIRNSISDYTINTSDGNCDTTAESSNLDESSTKSRTKLKKSVSFDPNDEKVRKFTSGDPIVDQKNPFKSNGLNGSLTNGKKKKTPPPVPAKRSTLSIRKTVTQQLREREREKEKEKERLKNEANNRKNHLSNGSAKLASPEDFITTADVLKQSKYVKTYIKNPDPYFVYDPTILARLKFEELRELTEKKPPKKLKLTNQTKERLKDIKSKSPTSATCPAFKKCSKPNYPELSDIKIKTGTESDGVFFNPAEVTKNAKKFDERVKKLQIGVEDDLDEIDEPLTKSESSDEVPLVARNSVANDTNLNEQSEKTLPTDVMSVEKAENQSAIVGTFTNTIKSKEFQEYLDKKGLTIIPKKIPNGAQSIYTNGGTQKIKPQQTHISFKSPESVQISIDTMDSGQNQAKKPSVFQRLLSNSIFASRRRTTPKESIPNPRSLNDFNAKCKENGVAGHNNSPLKRVVLERQSYHGRPRASNLLSAVEALDLKNQTERSRKSFASGEDDMSISISSALTNAEYMDFLEAKQPNNFTTTAALRKHDSQTKPLSKPPRRTLSRDRLSNLQQNKMQQEPLAKPKTLNLQNSGNSLYAQSKENIEKARELSAAAAEAVHFRRSLERQSLLPKRTTQPSDRRQIFGRSTSMDRNEILKRSAHRNFATRSISVNEALKSPTNTSIISKEDLQEEFSARNGPKLTSTPVRNLGANVLHSPKSPAAVTVKPMNHGMYVDQLEWERLRVMKERTDRELYYRVLQQQQQQQLQQQQQQQQQKHQQQQQQQQYNLQQQRQAGENIYERLPAHQVIVHQQPQYVPENNFMRGSPQRNTFSGLTRNRQAKIIDGKALLAIEQAPTLRSQSSLDGVTHGARTGMRRGYESDTETPVILRRRNPSVNEAQQPRRIGGILTREEILQKVKEFCRKSMNKTPTMQAIYEKQPSGTDLSPVSYVSVETHQRPMSRMYAAPQVPQRMQSLPQRFVPITNETVNEPNTATSSPIYAHVIKRSSLQSNQSDLYDTPQRPYLVRRENELVQPTFVSRGTLQRPETQFAPVQYVILDSDKIAPTQLLDYQHPAIAGHYARPEYVCVQQLQTVPGNYGYTPVREAGVPQQMRQRLHDGRSTPLILDRSSQQASQIYWTPQHQRLQQHTGLLPVQISPRYTTKQPYAIVPTKAAESAYVGNRMVRMNHKHQPQLVNIPNQMQSNVVLTTKPTTQQQVQQQQQQQQQPQQMQTTTLAPTKVAVECHAQNNYEWESGSEGEVQRIMEQQRHSGEFKSANIFANLKQKLSRFLRSTQR